MARDMISFKISGNFKNSERFFKRVKDGAYLKDLDKYGLMGVRALSAATPVNSGTTAASWSYTIERTAEGIRIVWTNSNINDGVNIALILNTGHGTRSGHWVEGRNYINPALEPVFDEIAAGAWKEVTA